MFTPARFPVAVHERVGKSSVGSGYQLCSMLAHLGEDVTPAARLVSLISPLRLPTVEDIRGEVTDLRHPGRSSEA